MTPPFRPGRPVVGTNAAGVFLYFPSCTRLGGGKAGEVAVDGACNTAASISSLHRSLSTFNDPTIRPSIPSLLALRLGASTHHHRPSRHRPVLRYRYRGYPWKQQHLFPARPRAAARHQDSAPPSRAHAGVGAECGVPPCHHHHALATAVLGLEMPFRRRQLPSPWVISPPVSACDAMHPA